MTERMSDAEVLARMKAMTPEQIVARLRSLFKEKRRLLAAAGGRARKGSAAVRAACRRSAMAQYRADLERLKHERGD